MTVKSSSGVASGVAATLPFTGFPLWIVVLGGLGSLLVGLTLYHWIRPESE